MDRPLILLLESLIRRKCWQEVGSNNIGDRIKECENWPENEDKVKHVLNIYCDYWKIADEKNCEYYNILMSQFMEFKRDNVNFPPEIIKELNSLSNITILLIPKLDQQTVKDGYTVPVDIRRIIRKRKRESESDMRDIKKARKLE